MNRRKITDIVADIAKYMAEGDSIGIARRKSIQPPSHKLEVVVMRHPAYVKLLNEYMVRVGKPIYYVLAETEDGPRLIKLNRKGRVAGIETTLPHS